LRASTKQSSTLSVTLDRFVADAARDDEDGFLPWR
jgi:hypothetical protein